MGRLEDFIHKKKRWTKVVEMRIQTLISSNEIDAFPDVIKYRLDELKAFRLFPISFISGLNALESAAHMGRPEICQILLPFFPIAPALTQAVKMDNPDCVRVLLNALSSSDDRLTKKETKSLLDRAFSSGLNAVAKIILDAGYIINTVAPTWAHVYVRCLAARRLATRATQRALKHAGLHKDVIPMIVELIAESEVYGQWDKTWVNL
ncbi:MAG: hypothetical protein ABIP54_04140 [Candidatus Andersenbacteria bacterium]